MKQIEEHIATRPLPGAARKEEPLASTKHSASEPESDGLPKRQRVIILAVMLIGTGTACISQSMMISALPAVMHEFSVNASLGQLITTSYIFTLGLISALTAFLINRFETRPLFFAAMGTFVIGCALSLVAPNYPLLLLSRLVQAGGAGILLPLLQVVALSVYPKSEYGRAMGIAGLTIGFAPAIGPTISGVIIDAWGWRAVFACLGAVAILCAVAAFFLLTDVVKRSKDHGRLDVASALLYACGFCLVLIGATFMEESGQVSPLAVALLVAGTLVLASFARRQLRVANPFLKLACFRDRTFAVSTMLVVFAHIAFMAPSIMVPLFVQDIQGQSAAVSGLVILPGAVLLGILNPVTGRLLDKHGPRPLLAVGGALIVAGTLAFSACTEAVPEWLVTVLYGVRIVGIACIMMPMTGHACTTLPPEDLPQGTAIITSFRQIIGSISASVLITVMSVSSSNALGVDVHGFSVSFLVQAAVVAFGVILGFVLLPRKRGKE